MNIKIFSFVQQVDGVGKMHDTEQHGGSDEFVFFLASKREEIRARDQDEAKHSCSNGGAFDVDVDESRKDGKQQR